MQELDATTKQENIKMYATPWCGDCRMAKRWFDAQSIPYEYITGINYVTQWLFVCLFV
ncbi:MAG TPA: glutaredoxin domain-containing protein [Ktedonobacteraceae bacterium]